MARPRRPLAPDREFRLLQAARRHFATSGYAQASTAGIAEEAGFSRSSLYHQYRDRQALFDAAFADGIRRLGEQCTPPDPRALGPETFWPALHGYVDALLAIAEKGELTSVGIMFHLPDRPHSRVVLDWQQRVGTWLEETLARGREIGTVDRTVPADLQLATVTALLVGLDRWGLDNADRPGRMRAVVDLILGRLLLPLDPPTTTTPDDEPSRTRRSRS